MLRRLISRIQVAVLAYPGRVLAGSLALLVLSLAAGSRVEFRTARSELAPPDDPDQKRLEALGREFAGSSALIVCVEAAPPAHDTPGEAGADSRLRAFADAVAAEIGKDPAVDSVFYRIDLDWFLEHALYLVPPTVVRAFAAGFAGERATLRALQDVRDVAGLNDRIAARIEAGLAGAAGPGSAGGAETAGLRALAFLLRAERRFLQDPEAAVASLAGTPPLRALAGAAAPDLAARGYLSTRDGSTLFLIVSPKDGDDSLPALRRFVGAMRERVARVAAAHPGLRVAFTGEPATTVEEMDIVRRDTWFTAAVSGLGVTLLTLLVFRWRAHALLLLAALVMGVGWSFGAVLPELGYLNLITSSFISTLVGVGIAYGIHPVSEYELLGAHTGGAPAAIREAYHRTGAAITVGAVTTAAAFFAIMLMEFRGFAELGLVAGVGVLLCLLASLVSLPALLAIHGGWRAERERRPAGRSPAGPAPPTAAVDRLWHERGAGIVCRFPRTVTAAALVATAASAWGARGISFNTNFLDLLPRDAESLLYQRRMVLDSDLSPAFNIVVADDLQGLGRLRDLASREPTIARFESALQFLPEDEMRSRAAIDALRPLLDDVRLPQTSRPADRERIVASLARLQEALARASEAAFGAGLGPVAAALEEARQEAGSAAAAAREAPPEAEGAWNDAQDRLLDWGRRALADLRSAADAAPPGLAELPEEIRSRFVTGSGRLLGFLLPAGNAFDPVFLESYVEASRRVSADAAGFPIVFRGMSRRITSGFYRAVLWGAAMVAVILLIDYRNLRDAALATIPLVIGMIWMMGGMRLLGLSFNFANLVTVPLIIGVGIDNGVHVVHRLRLEGEKGMTVVLRHTGRAILIAGLTTMIGFGSLALASHRGLASLGLVLLMGVLACVIAATVVLPNLLVAFGRART